MVFDSQAFKQNCENFANFHPKARNLLASANGEKSYEQIAKEHRVHRTTVSSTLTYAEKLGLAKKRVGIYKKLPGVMSHIPIFKNKIAKKKTVPQIMNSVSNKKIKNIAESLRKKLDPVKYNAAFLSKLEKMLWAYAWLYTVENLLRELIRRVLSNQDNWWDEKVPDGVKRSVEKTMDNQPYDAAKRKDELEHTHLGELIQIIISRQNWNSFKPYLNESDKETFKVRITDAIESRNAIGHCIPLAGEDLRRSDIRFLDIVKMLK